MLGCDSGTNLKRFAIAAIEVDQNAVLAECTLLSSSGRHAIS
jgi:hypothetical protein